MNLRRVTRISLIMICLAFPSLQAMGASWKVRLTIVLPSAAVALCFSPDAKLIAVGHSDGKVTVWETTRGQLVQTLVGHSAEIRALRFAPGGAKLLTLGRDNQARIWSAPGWTQTDLIDDIGFSLAISPDSRWLAAQDSKQAIWLWDFMSLKRERQLVKAGVGGAPNMHFTSNDHLVLLYGSNPHRINIGTGEDTIIPVKTSKPEIEVRQTGPDQFAFSLGALSDDSAMSHNLAVSRGSLVAVGRAWYGKPAFVDVFDLARMQRVHRLKPKVGGTQASFSFDGTILAIEGAEQVTLWKMADGKQFASLKGDGLVEFSPTALELAVTDGSTLLIYSPK